jgi:hypothetical protein
LPKDAHVEVEPVLADVHRLEVHAPNAARAQDWLTVVQAQADADARAPSHETLSNDEGNVTGADAVGVHITGDVEQIVLFASQSGTVTELQYTVAQRARGLHVLSGLVPSDSGYAVTTLREGDDLVIDVKVGGEIESTQNGTLAFSLDPEEGPTPVARPLTQGPMAEGGSSSLEPDSAGMEPASGVNSGSEVQPEATRDSSLPQDYERPVQSTPTSTGECSPTPGGR